MNLDLEELGNMKIELVDIDEPPEVEATHVNNTASHTPMRRMSEELAELRVPNIHEFMTRKKLLYL